MEQLIFEKPSLAPLPHRLGWAFVTGLFWLLWVYLWLPLLTLIAWALGLQAYTGYFDDALLLKIHQMKQIAFLYTSIVAAMGGTLLLWARIEFLRFRDVNRRTCPEPVQVDELAAYADLPLENLQAWTIARRVVAHHDHHGHVMIRKRENPAR